jgi:large exoprotein involved in heme utilization and adhesion
MRNDNVITICEIKNLNSKIGTSVIREFNEKLKNLKFPDKYTIQKALITINGADSSLVDSDYFDHVLTINDFM